MTDDPLMAERANSDDGERRREEVSLSLAELMGPLELDRLYFCVEETVSQGISYF